MKTGLGLQIMRQADGAKYVQHRDLADLLFATGSAKLIEDSRSEPFGEPALMTLVRTGRAAS